MFRVLCNGGFRANRYVRSYHAVHKGVVSPRKAAPVGVNPPNYAKTGTPVSASYPVHIFDADDVHYMRDAAKFARYILDYTCSRAEVGMTTDELDQIAHAEIIRHKVYPSPLNYSSFPKSICTSINEVTCHGIPDSRKLCNGDILSVDVSVFMNGYHGDNCKTVIVGEGDENAVRLVRVSEEALLEAIKICGPGVRLSDIGSTIEDYANLRNFQVVHEMYGHGLGKNLHMTPNIAHFRHEDDEQMLPGMIFTIEPILVEKKRQIGIWEDNWTLVTLDGGRAAQFEHEVLITEHGHEILTVPNDGPPY